ncbi:MAG: helicase-exonuclease AddAB subunit AddA [Lachnospiraceae bacterium]|nr:helicase-exonuclease AddAB subunit AddA [Lachnospiraceae bacterium]
MAQAFNLSPDQQAVVDSRNQNILVSAAAGSGKTRVLTERIVGRVTDPSDPVDIDRILVVTFTNAAAKEMKERISRAISEKIADNPGDAHLEKQATLIHNAQITTIDSFCLYVLKNNFHKIGADPSFRVMSEGEKKLLMQEVMEELINDSYDSGSENFHHIVDCYSKKNTDDSLEKSIYGLFNYACSYPWPMDWLLKRKEDYAYETAEELNNSQLMRDIYALSELEIKRMIKLAGAALRLAESDPGHEPMASIISAEMEMFESIIGEIASGKSFDEIRGFLGSVSFARASTKKDADPVVKEQVTKIRNRYKKKLSDLSEKFFYDDSESIVKAMKVAERNVSTLVDLTVSFAERFEKAKKDRGVIDFSDMEHMAVAILVDQENSAGDHYAYTDVADMYRDYYREVMIDEYQDSNLVQELILASISRPEGKENGNRFMVGDIKQSIYSFRMARPEIFMSKIGAYSKDAGAVDRLITLKNNYRSRDCVINSVNAIFENIMSLTEGGVDYDEDQRLYRGADYPADSLDNISEVMLISSVGGKAREKEARMIASKIRALVGKFMVTGKDGEMRPAHYGDCAVLFRSPTKWTGIISRALEEAGIPYHMEGVGSFYDAREIRDVLSFLEILDNPLSDISLYAAMTSHFGGFTDEECARIKTGGESGYYLWDKLTEYHASNPDDEKVNAFLLRVDKYRAMVVNEPIDVLLSRLIDETGYRHVTSALPGGRQRLANLELLVSKARDYANSSFKGLFHFLRFIELIRKTDTEEGEAGILDETADVVRVMSIHKSKGLEFPVCILGGIFDQFNNSDAYAAFANNIDAGIGAFAIDPVNRIKQKTLRQSYVAGKILADALSEEIRVLYVALTRAKEKLILTGSVKEPEAWFAAETSGKEGCYADLIEESVNAHKNVYFKQVIFDEEAKENAEIAETIDKAALRAELEAGLPGDTEVTKRLRERFAYRYPLNYPAELSIKTTVSKLKLSAMEAEEGVPEPFEEVNTTEYIPRFAGAKEEVKGTDRGTAYHTLMQLTDFAGFVNCRDRAEIEAEFKAQTGRLIENGKLTEELLSRINREKVYGFLETETAKEMGRAAGDGQLYKEQPFVIGVKASEVDPSFPDTETMLVQGVIDVYYIRDGRVTVLDYKTDRVDSGEELIKRYKTQLDYYAMAINKLTGLAIGGKVIYSFGLGSIIMVD